MSVEITDLYADGVSNCCGAAVLDPSGNDEEGICHQCGEHCGVEPTKVERIFDAAAMATSESEWKAIVDLAHDIDLDLEILTKYVDEVAPHTDDDWTYRGELFETALQIMSAMREFERRESEKK